MLMTTSLQDHWHTAVSKLGLKVVKVFWVDLPCDVPSGYAVLLTLNYIESKSWTIPLCPQLRPVSSGTSFSGKKTKMTKLFHVLAGPRLSFAKRTGVVGSCLFSSALVWELKNSLFFQDLTSDEGNSYFIWLIREFAWRTKGICLLTAEQMTK